MFRVARRPRAARSPLPLALAAVLAGLLAGCSSSGLSHHGGSAPRTAAPAGGTVRVGATPTGPAVPNGFLGISMEYKELEADAGTSPRALDVAFVQLLRNLAPQGGAVLRIGGDSSDWTWWPVPGVVAPGGIKYALTPAWAQVAKTVAQSARGRLILGIQFEADSARIAAYEENQLLSHIGAASIDAFELGNEPELYAAFPWFKTATGQHVRGRAPGYTIAAYESDFARIAASLPSAPLAGPSIGGPEWLADLTSFVHGEPRVGLITIHAYPLKHCSSATVETAAELFDTASLQGLADQIAGWSRIAGERHLPLRVDEMNSVSCGGQRGLSNAFAPALWALDMLPRLAATGIVGVNFHTVTNGTNSLISATDHAGGWQVAAQPEYLGLMAFAQAAPPGSRLLAVGAAPSPGIDVWAARAANGIVHAVVINTGSSARTVRVQIAGVSGPASAVVLKAASLGSTSGVTLGGQTLSSSTGVLSGAPTATTITPSSGSYSVNVAGPSASILTIPAS